jgi:hypothetical protein
LQALRFPGEQRKEPSGIGYAGRTHARPQQCLTTTQIEQLVHAAEAEEPVAFALMVYAGLRIGKVEHLRWEDVQLRDGPPVTLHVRRGGLCEHERNGPEQPDLADLGEQADSPSRAANSREALSAPFQMTRALGILSGLENGGTIVCG